MTVSRLTRTRLAGDGKTSRSLEVKNDTKSDPGAAVTGLSR